MAKFLVILLAFIAAATAYPALHEGNVRIVRAVYNPFNFNPYSQYDQYSQYNNYNQYPLQYQQRYPVQYVNRPLLRAPQQQTGSTYAAASANSGFGGSSSATASANSGFLGELGIF